MSRLTLADLSSFACYYGLNRIDDLSRYSFVILQAEQYTPTDMAILADRHSTITAYLSLGEIPSELVNQMHTSWLLSDPATGKLVQNHRWHTTQVDFRSEIWQRWIVEERIPQLLSYGVHGLFLDNVDVAETYAFMHPGIKATLHRIRQAYPDIVLVMNRGFDILESVQSVIDAIVFESFTSYHNGQSYKVWTGTDLEWTEYMVKYLNHVVPHIPILAIDYAASDDKILRARAMERAMAHGYVPFVTTYALDWLPTF